MLSKRNVFIKAIYLAKQHHSLRGIHTSPTIRRGPERVPHGGVETLRAALLRKGRSG